MCGRMAECGLATEQQCLPACQKEVGRLSPQEQATLADSMRKATCEQITQAFRNGQGGAAPQQP